MNPNNDASRSVMIRPAAPSDLHSVLQIRQAQEQSENAERYTTAEQLAAEWEAQGSRLDEQVWVAVAPEGSLIACAELRREDNVFNPCLWAQPERRDLALAAALLARAERQAEALGRADGARSVRLFAQATSACPEIQQALAQAAYTVTSSYEQMELALSEASARSASVPGIEIRPFDSERDDMEAVYRADEEAFQDERGHTPRTFEQWRQRLNLSGEAFDPALWLIAWDGDEIAGAALGERIKSVGWIHHLFVRQPWRRRGLGAALTRSALGAFYQRGLGAARLNVDGQSLTNAQQLYRRVGFQVIRAYSNYEKFVSLA